MKSGFYFTYAKSGTKKTIWFMNEKFSYVSPSYSPDYWLEEVPEESQLKADKEELLEALEIFIEQNTPTFTSHDYEFPEHVMKAKSLIQKHKQ